MFAQKVDNSVVYDYSDDVEFTIRTMNGKRISDRGAQNVTIIAKKGMRFLSLSLKFENKSSEEQILDFEQFFIQDQSGDLHKVDFVIMSGKLTMSTTRFQQKLKAKSNRILFLEFVPAIEKDEVMTAFIIDGTSYKIVYKD